jgi:hypothetical protein
VLASAGLLLLLIILLDMFLTVLHARIGTSIIGFRKASEACGSNEEPFSPYAVR